MCQWIKRDNVLAPDRTTLLRRVQCNGAGVAAHLGINVHTLRELPWCKSAFSSAPLSCAFDVGWATKSSPYGAILSLTHWRAC